MILRYFKEVKLKIIFLIIICSLFSFIVNVDAASSISEINSNNSKMEIIEHLRIHVPKDSIKAWLKAEKGSWENWLACQDGFLGRELLWDPKNEEATLLIRWSSRRKWKLIPISDIDSIQNKFEEIAREELGDKEEHPFPIVFEGELLPQ